MLPLCADQRIGVLPWSPLARGRLTRDWDQTTNRSETDAFGSTSTTRTRATGTIVERVAEIADAARRPPCPGGAGVGAARNPVVTAPIVGASKPQHVDDAVAALELELGEDEVRRLEEPYRPHPVAGF